MQRTCEGRNHTPDHIVNGLGECPTCGRWVFTTPAGLIGAHIDRRTQPAPAGTQPISAELQAAMRRFFR